MTAGGARAPRRHYSKEYGRRSTITPSSCSAANRRGAARNSGLNCTKSDVPHNSAWMSGCPATSNTPPDKPPRLVVARWAPGLAR